MFDALGREVDIIVDEYKNVGFHSTLYILTSALPGEVYFYQLKVGSFAETKEMILMK